MNYNFNKIIEQRLSLTDCSLLSEATDINELSFEKNLVNKHVRFNAKTLVGSNNNSSFLNASIVSDASLLETESEFNKIACVELNESAASDRTNYDKLKSHGRMSHSDYLGPLNSPLTVSDYTTVDEIMTIQGRTEEDNDDTSIWSSGTDVSNDDCSTDLHLTSTPRPGLFQAIDRMASRTSAQSSSPADTVVSDNVSDNGSTVNDAIDVNFDIPVSNSSKYLKDKIQSLSVDLKFHQTNLSSTAKELAVKKLNEQLHMKDRFNENNSCAFVSRTPVELTQPLNIRQSVELYPDLTAVDVRNESIFIAQQRKLAAIRRRVGVDKVHKKAEDGLPEPDLMEFFEPKKHLYKSVNLSTGSNLINLRPTLSLADRRLYSVFRDRDLLNMFQ